MTLRTFCTCMTPMELPEGAEVACGACGRRWVLARFGDAVQALPEPEGVFRHRMEAGTLKGEMDRLRRQVTEMERGLSWPVRMLLNVAAWFEMVRHRLRRPRGVRWSWAKTPRTIGTRTRIKTGFDGPQHVNCRSQLRTVNGAEMREVTLTEDHIRKAQAIKETAPTWNREATTEGMSHPVTGVYRNDAESRFEAWVSAPHSPQELMVGNIDYSAPTDAVAEWSRDVWSTTGVQPFLVEGVPLLTQSQAEAHVTWLRTVLGAVGTALSQVAAFLSSSGEEERASAVGDVMAEVAQAVNLLEAAEWPEPVRVLIHEADRAALVLGEHFPKLSEDIRLAVATMAQREGGR